MVKVQCILDYNDLQLNKLVTTKDDPFIVTKERADVLVDKGLVKVVEVIPGLVEEEKAPEPKKQVAKKQTKRK